MRRAAPIGNPRPATPRTSPQPTEPIEMVVRSEAANRASRPGARACRRLAQGELPPSLGGVRRTRSGDGRGLRPRRCGRVRRPRCRGRRREARRWPGHPVETADGFSQTLFDVHPAGAALDDRLGRKVGRVGDEPCGLITVEAGDRELTGVCLGRRTAWSVGLRARAPGGSCRCVHSGVGSQGRPMRAAWIAEIAPMP